MCDWSGAVSPATPDRQGTIRSLHTWRRRTGDRGISKDWDIARGALSTTRVGGRRWVAWLSCTELGMAGWLSSPTHMAHRSVVLAHVAPDDVLLAAAALRRPVPGSWGGVGSSLCSQISLATGQRRIALTVEGSPHLCALSRSFLEFGIPACFLICWRSTSGRLFLLAAGVIAHVDSKRQ